MEKIMVLNDAETYTSYEGCFAVEVIRDMEDEPLASDETLDDVLEKILIDEGIRPEQLWMDREKFYIGKIVQEF